jgi:O-antigen ligase
LLGKIIFGALVCVVVITQIPYGTVEPWWKAVFICFVLALFLIEIVSKGASRFDPKPLLLPLLALTLLAFVQAGTGISADNFQTKFFALQLAGLTAFLALLYRYAATEQRVRVLVFVVIGIAITTAIFGLLRQTSQHQTGFLLPLLRKDQGFAQFINKNHFAYLMEMAFGLGVGLIFFDRSRHRMIYVALLLPICVGVAVSNSRGGIVAIVAEVIVAALLLMKRSVLKIAFAAVLIAGVLLWAAASELTLSAAREGASRTDIWWATIKLFAAHPLLGIGLGAYWIGITAHHDASGVLVPQEAHNDYLELLASGGVIGFALGVWFVVSVVNSARKNLWSNTGFVRAARVGALLGIAGVAIHSLLDFGLHLMSNAVVFLTLIMMVTAQIDSEKVVDLNLMKQ